GPGPGEQVPGQHHEQRDDDDLVAEEPNSEPAKYTSASKASIELSSATGGMSTMSRRRTAITLAATTTSGSTGANTSHCITISVGLTAAGPPPPADHPGFGALSRVIRPGRR
ncbi:MAG: hypothetical protein QOH17_2344, partial [Pseudonocardiales bacterium]|nr:hypothetical protein [Pseudonocardiales bacterium]